MSKLPSLEVVSSCSEKIDTDVVGFYQETSKKNISNYHWIEKLRKSESWDCSFGSLQLLKWLEKETLETVLVVGLGPNTTHLLDSVSNEGAFHEKFRVLGSQVRSRLSAEKANTATIQVDSFLDWKGFSTKASALHSLRAFAEGFILSSYHFDKYKKEGQVEQGVNRVVFVVQDKSLKAQFELVLEQVSLMGEVVQLTRDWSNEPSNYGTPEYFAAETKQIARRYGLKYKAITEQEAARENMGLFLGVGQGSERESSCVIVEYSPKTVKNQKTIVLVGKGVTFDSGGISIKPSSHMEEMKHDMTGAATVLGALLLAVAQNSPHHIVAIMGFVENMPDGHAIQPGNILTARNGKTVEIINTDAEGRLILADALDYAHDYKPDVLIDVATLTGAVSVALGKYCCAVLGNHQKLIDTLIQVGEDCGERIWQLPLFEDYLEDLKSESADLKNSSNDSGAGTIRGAIFLQQFIKKDVAWAHLDIAGVAYHLNHLPYCPKKGASGAYVRTLARFLCDYEA